MDDPVLAQICAPLTEAEAAEVARVYYYDDEAAERKARYYRLTRAGGIRLPLGPGPYTHEQIADFKSKGVR